MNGKEKGAKKEEVEMKQHREWRSCLKNPRIVRVSRAFGGKDRHSKVCTIRGLRDRRIRLSVPTAIQLYDLQDRLGLSQPSKVVDWLMDATKHEIEKLPPLPMIPTNLTDQEAGMKWNISSSENNNEGFGGFLQNFFPLNTPFSNPSNFFHWEPPQYSFPQHHSLSDHQLYLSPSATAVPSITANPPFHSMENIEHHLRQINHDHHHLQQTSSLFPTTLHFITSPMKSSTLTALYSKDFFSQDNGDGKQEKHKTSY